MFFVYKPGDSHVVNYSNKLFKIMQSGSLKKQRLVCQSLLLLSLFLYTAKPAAAIAVGDLAVIGFNSDAAITTKDFTIVALAHIASGQTIYITDKGWTGVAGGSFIPDITSEGIIQWTTSAIPAGTVIRFVVVAGASPSVSASPSVGTVSIINGWTNTTASTSPFGTTGDQILIYQGSAASPTFIYGFTNSGSIVDVTNGWQTTTVTSNRDSNIPAGLTNGTNAVSFCTLSGSQDNYVYTGSFSGTKIALLASISNKTNWIGDDVTAYNIAPGGTQFPGSQPIFSLSGTLPVSLTGFDATLTAAGVQLSWQTAGESNSRSFIVQHSTDGTRWQPLHTIASAGNSVVMQQYGYLHTNPPAGFNAYRLQCVDIDGSSAWSAILSVNVKPGSATAIRLYPTPAEDILVADMGTLFSAPVAYSILNSAGSIVGKGWLSRPKQSLPVQQLGSGLYYLKVDKQEPVPFMKK